MTPERWQQLSAIFQAALTRPSAGREAYLVEACRADPTLRSEVDAMLAAHSNAGPFGDTSMLVFEDEGRRFEPGTQLRRRAGEWALRKRAGRGLLEAVIQWRL